MSLTENSSKHSTQACSASARATGGIGSSSCDFAALQRLAMAVDAVMRVGHEVVEVDAPLAPHRDKLEEHVHQHGLAAPDAAMDVEAAHRRMHVAALGEQPAERTRLRRDALGADVVDQPVERARQPFLRGIVRDLAALDEMLVALRRPSHGSVSRRAGASVALCRGDDAPGCEAQRLSEMGMPLRSGRRSARRRTNRAGQARRRPHHRAPTACRRHSTI